MATIESVKTQIQTLIEQANTKTGIASTNLTSAVNTLCEGYGQGGASDVVAWVNFYNEDGSVKYGQRAVIKGDDCPNPLDEDLFTTPTKEPTQANTYTFEGWSTSIGGSTNSFALVDITQDTTLYATFEENVRYYSVRFYDGTTLIKTEQVAYGGSSSYKYEKTDYIFNGWTPKPTNVTSDMSCYGEWIVDDGYIHDSWDEIAQYVANGEHTTRYAIGDMKQLEIKDYKNNTIIVDMVVSAFNHDDLADGSGKAGITFITRKLVYVGYIVGGESTSKWSSSIARTWCKGTLYKQLPTELQSSIKSVTKLSNLADKTVETTEDTIWIPSITEVGLKQSDYAADGVHYSERFPNNASRNIDMTQQSDSSDFTNTWSTRSRNATTKYAQAVSAFGTYASQPSDTNNVTLIGFCI